MGIQQMGVQTHTLSLPSFEILGKHMVVNKRYSSACTCTCTCTCTCICTCTCTCTCTLTATSRP